MKRHVQDLLVFEECHWLVLFMLSMRIMPLETVFGPPSYMVHYAHPLIWFNMQTIRVPYCTYDQ